MIVYLRQVDEGVTMDETVLNLATENPNFVPRKGDIVVDNDKKYVADGAVWDIQQQIVVIPVHRFHEINESVRPL